MRREIASAALRLGKSEDASAVVDALLAHAEDAKDPMIPQLLWLAYEPRLVKNPTAEVAFLAKNAGGNALIADQIVPRAVQRLVATGKPEDLNACVKLAAGATDATRVRTLRAMTDAVGSRTLDEPADWKAAKVEFAKDGSRDVAALVNSLGVKFRDPTAVAKALKIAADDTAPLADRLAAVRDLGVSRSPTAVVPLLDFTTKEAAAELRAEAIRALGFMDAPDIAGKLIAAWPTLSPTLKNEAVNVLAGRKEWAAALLKAVGDKAITRTELTDNTIIRIQALKDKNLDAAVEKVWGRVRSTPADLAKLIDTMRGELAKAPGSFDKGKKIFEQHCAKCHKFDGGGHEVGPNIEGAGRDIEYLLVNVLDPNRVIGAPYFLRTVRLENGRVETGILHAEDDKTVTLKQENAQLKTIPKKDIEENTIQEKSLMPEGLGYSMTTQDFRDLVRYVMANPFLTTVRVKTWVRDATPPAGVSGRIELADGVPSATIWAEVTAPAALKTRLLLGVREDCDVSVNGSKPVRVKGSGRDAEPDQVAVDVDLKEGRNEIEITVPKTEAKGAAVYARLLDPERKLRYPDAK